MLRPLLTLAILCLSLLAQGATWTVAVDGSGDFTTIQEAVDAAQDGDQIVVGPGRYDVVTDPGPWSYIVVSPKVLDFVGAGSDQTIIGPENPEDASDGLCGIYLTRGGSMRGFRFEHCNLTGIMHDEAISIEDCHFVHHGDDATYPSGRRAVYLPSPNVSAGGHARHCRFEGLGHAVAGRGGWTLEECDFLNCETGVYSWESSEPLMVTGCTFEAVVDAVSLRWDSSAIIDDCDLVESRIKIALTNNVQILNSRIHGSTDLQGVLIDRSSDIIITGNVVSNSVGPVIEVDRAESLLFRDNHVIATGAAWAVYCPPGDEPGRPLDMTRNWWGADDPDVVAETIWDWFDDPSACHRIVFEPMAGQPVRTAGRSWSSVKQLFR